MIYAESVSIWWRQQQKKKRYEYPVFVCGEPAMTVRVIQSHHSQQRTPIGQRKHKNNIESSQMVVGIGKLRQIEMVPDCLYISDSAFHVNCVAHNALQMPAVIHYLRAVHFHY